MPPKKEKNKRQVLPGQQKITGFFQKPQGSLEDQKTGRLLSCYGGSNGIVKQTPFPSLVKRETNGVKHPDVLQELPDIKSCNCLVHVENGCCIRKRSDASSPVTDKPVKAARLRSPFSDSTLTSLRHKPNLKCKTRLFEKSRRRKGYLNGRKNTNPFSIVKGQEPRDCVGSHENGQISVLQLSDLDDSLNDSGLLKLYLGETLNNDNPQNDGGDMEATADKLDVSTIEDNDARELGMMRPDSAKSSLSLDTDDINLILDNTTPLIASESLSHILDEVEFAPVKSQQPADSLQTPESISRPLCSRCVVKSVSVRGVADGSSIYKGQEELVLELETVESNKLKLCLLRDDWTTTSVSTGDCVHIVGPFPPTADTLVLDNSTNAFIIVHPDILIQGTSVASATRCIRRSLLDGIFKNGNLASELTLIGTMAHQIFDEAMKKCDFSTSWLTATTKSVTRKVKNLDMMFSLGISEELVLRKITELLPALQKWAAMFVCPVACTDNGENKQFRAAKSGCRTPISVTELHDIEENIWSPQFGLKGKIDATVEVKIHHRPSAESSFKSFESPGNVLVPLELKTGKMMSQLGSVDHRAQVILYSLMLSDRHEVDVPTGLLLYLKTGHMTGVPSPLNEQRALIMKRNEVAQYVATRFSSNSRAFDFPPVLGAGHRASCLRCPQQSNCMLYHRAVEGGSSVSSGISDKFDALVGHFSEKELSYFRTWCKMVSLESRAQHKKVHQHKLWTTTPELRQKQGSCFSGMQLLSVESSTSKSNTFIHTFTSTTGTNDTSLLTDQNINKGDLIVVSRQRKEPNRLELAVATGFILDMDHHQCTVNLDKELNMHVHSVYHIDKHESLSAFNTSFSNLADLFVSENSKFSHHLRQLIIDLQPPHFIIPKCEYLHKALECVNSLRTSQPQIDNAPSRLRDILSTLNSDQLFAVEKVLSASDYALILGMPGTGKTTTIACIVQVLVECGKRVLLASYTHSAVDNVLIKLQKAGVDCLRVGNPDKVHAAVRSKTVSELTNAVTTVAELQSIYMSKPVVATTCLGVNQACFTQLRFDYCIVDEASQITQPVCLGPLFYADVFVLVGDHHQLPPLVQSSEARDAGMDVSMFKRLSDEYPSAVVYLEHQYRMNKDIMLLSNSVIYDNQLKCATQLVADEVMHLPQWNQWRQCMEYEHSHLTWMMRAVNPMNTVVFLDTDMLDGDEVRSHGSLRNDVEAKLVLWLALEFLKAGSVGSAIGVISPYRSQLKTIHGIFSEKQHEHLTSIEIDTVDKYQGRDKSCILVSLVRKNKDRNVGDLLTDWRRVNVTLTRARHKLILIGSCQTLSQSPILQSLLKVISTHNWMVNLPTRALQDPRFTHFWNEQL